MLYIQRAHEENVHSTQYKQVIIHKVKARTLHLLHEVLTKILISIADHVIISLDPNPCCIQEVSIITVEYQRSSSIRIIFVDYQTSELQCNY